MKAAAALVLALALSARSATAQPAMPSSADDHIDTVQVTAPKVPLDKAINNFVKSYAAPSIAADKIPKWASSICPIAEGLTPVQNVGISEFVKQIATQIGAPVATKTPCDLNVEIIFTRTPQAVLDDIAKNYEDLLGYHDVSQTKRIATMKHPVQAWYATATRTYNGVLQVDDSQRFDKCMIVYHSFKKCGSSAMGGRIMDGKHSEFSYVTIIVDVNKLGELGIKPVANYVAMLALSQTQAYETCQPLMSITNLMTSDCDSIFKSNMLSESDIAYLKALYKMNSNVMLAGQQSDIAHQMEAELGGH